MNPSEPLPHSRRYFYKIKHEHGPAPWTGAPGCVLMLMHLPGVSWWSHPTAVCHGFNLRQSIALNGSYIFSRMYVSKYTVEKNLTKKKEKKAGSVGTGGVEGCSVKKNTTNCVSLSWTISTTFLILNEKSLPNNPPFPFHVFKHNCWLAVIIVIISNINNNHQFISFWFYFPTKKVVALLFLWLFLCILPQSLIGVSHFTWTSVISYIYAYSNWLWFCLSLCIVSIKKKKT